MAVLGIAKSFQGQILQVQWIFQFYYKLFGQKLQDSKCVMCRGTVPMQAAMIGLHVWCLWSVVTKPC